MVAWKKRIIFFLTKFKNLPLRSRTDPDGMSNPGDNCKEIDASALEDGSMESIDEHCKNFATSSWTQFKVGC